MSQLIKMLLLSIVMIGCGKIDQTSAWKKFPLLIDVPLVSEITRITKLPDSKTGVYSGAFEIEFDTKDLQKSMQGVHVRLAQSKFKRLDFGQPEYFVMQRFYKDNSECRCRAERMSRWISELSSKRVEYMFEFEDKCDKSDNCVDSPVLDGRARLIILVSDAKHPEVR